jgi:nitroimidazol reductase NimA-like FMN-containing flavoprotein (pyridoxamine 5'-phosphate oxidase superfamily)
MLLTLEPDECWHLLERHQTGRLATAARGAADLFPVNYRTDGLSIVIATAEGAKVDQLVEDPHVAFEIDGHDSTGYWSVVVRGAAELMHPAERPPGLISWVPDAGSVLVRIRPQAVSGRRLERARFDGASVFGPLGTD